MHCLLFKVNVIYISVERCRHFPYPTPIQPNKQQQADGYTIPSLPLNAVDHFTGASLRHDMNNKLTQQI
jgi:hypothetical protein